MAKNQRSPIDYKTKYEKLLKKWQHEYVKNKVLTDLNKELNKQVIRQNTALDLLSKTETL